MNLIARNVNDALESSLWMLKTMMDRGEVKPSESRNGNVYRFPDPVMITYQRPCERILWSPERDCNPFFHMMECVWMMAGRNDAASLLPFNKQMGAYAEPAGYFHGAYGYRWRHAFGFDQLRPIIEELKENPASRRCVLSMWNPEMDLGHGMAKDLPCNTHIYFDIQDGALCMTVCNRSNDIIWGAFGANVVHFSFLQEYMAEMIGVPVGRYVQFSNNFHLYTGIGPGMKLLERIPPAEMDPYKLGEEWPYDGGLTTYGGYHMTSVDYQNFMAFPERKVSEHTSNQFLNDIAEPMRKFYLTRKEGKMDLTLLQDMPHCDWRTASLEWVQRRMVNG